MATTSRVYVPDQQLLRRFGLVRAVGGTAYFVAALVLAGIFGIRAWPLLLGVPVLAVVTTLYFRHSAAYPRAAVLGSLVADALVLGGAAAFVGGTGSGTLSVYVIVIVSAGILLGPASAAGFTVLSAVLSLLQLASEQMGTIPAFLHRPALGDRVPVLLITLAVQVSVGFLTATYASRLHRHIAEAGDRAEVVRQKGRRRRQFVRQATIDVEAPLQTVEAVAEQLGTAAELGAEDRQRLAATLRLSTAELEARVGQLADVGALDEASDHPPEPVSLHRVVQDCLLELRDRLASHEVSVEVGELKVVGDRRATRRIVFNLLENVCDHTPAGTGVRIQTRTTPGQGVLIVTDEGPGVPAALAPRLFDPPDEGGRPRVGLPLVRELAEGMGAVLRYEPAAAGGARFLVGFRLAPSATPTADDRAEASATG